MSSELQQPSRKESKKPITWDELENSRPLPVRFQLYASRRTNRALCPCLVVKSQGISVIRILDPEHMQPYISLDSIFLLSNRSIPTGILEFELSRDSGDYDLTLAGLEPREALWVPLKLAREIAEQVGLLEALGTLLDWDNRHIWSLDEGEAGLVHNWRASQLDADSYSTSLLTQTDIKSVSLLPRGQQVRTLLSQEQRQAASSRVSTMTNAASEELDLNRSKYEQRLLRWSVLACEELLGSQKNLKSSGDEEEEERFSLESSDMMLLFKDYLESVNVDTNFDSVSVDSEEILATRGADTSSHTLSKSEVYRRARINVMLIHHLWTMTMSQTRSDDNSRSPPEIQGSSLEPSEIDLKEQLKRIEASAKRSEWAMSELLSRKTAIPSIDNRLPRNSRRISYLDGIDFRLLIALLIGVLLGSMTSRV